MDKREFLRLLRPLSKRMLINNAIYCLFASLAAAGVVAMCLSYASLWFPVPFVTHLILYIFLAGIGAGIIISIFLLPSLKKVIAVADGLGLKERVVTAWQLREVASTVADLQREDTRKAVINTDFKKLYTLKFPVRPIAALATSALLIAVSFAVPGNAREDPRRIEVLMSEAKEQMEALEKVGKDLEKNNALGEKELDKKIGRAHV